jgi:hypothetical protein
MFSYSVGTLSIGKVIIEEWQVGGYLTLSPSPYVPPLQNANPTSFVIHLRSSKTLQLVPSKDNFQSVLDLYSILKINNILFLTLRPYLTTKPSRIGNACQSPCRRNPPSWKWTLNTMTTTSPPSAPTTKAATPGIPLRSKMHRSFSYERCSNRRDVRRDWIL